VAGDYILVRGAEGEQGLFAGLGQIDQTQVGPFHAKQGSVRGRHQRAALPRQQRQGSQAFLDSDVAQLRPGSNREGADSPSGLTHHQAVVHKGETGVAPVLELAGGAAPEQLQAGALELEDVQRDRPGVGGRQRRIALPVADDVGARLSLQGEDPLAAARARAHTQLLDQIYGHQAITCGHQQHALEQGGGGQHLTDAHQRLLQQGSAALEHLERARRVDGHEEPRGRDRGGPQAGFRLDGPELMEVLRQVDRPG